MKSASAFDQVARGFNHDGRSRIHEPAAVSSEVAWAMQLVPDAFVAETLRFLMEHESAAREVLRLQRLVLEVDPTGQTAVDELVTIPGPGSEESLELYIRVEGTPARYDQMKRELRRRWRELSLGQATYVFPVVLRRNKSVRQPTVS